MSKQKRIMDEAHKQKLREAYYNRKKAESEGVHLPTQKELRAAAKLKKEPITEQSVNKLVEETPVTAQEGRVNNPTVTRFESAPNTKLPLRLRIVRDCLAKR
jgi:hypothetical protein